NGRRERVFSTGGRCCVSRKMNRSHGVLDMQPTVSWSAVRIACGLASVIAAPFLFAQASGERLDIRTGSWEITARTTISGSPPWSQELRDKLTPEQRAELEA